MAFDEVKINTGIEHNCLVVSFVDLGNTSSGGVWAAVNPRVCIEFTKNEQSIEEHDSISCYTHAGFMVRGIFISLNCNAMRFNS